MEAKKFEKDREYLAWIEQNPTGYVLNTSKNTPASYMVLHGAGCHTVRPNKSTAPGAFTERKYIKVCSLDSKELARWIGEHGGSGFSKRCAACNPVA